MMESKAMCWGKEYEEAKMCFSSSAMYWIVLEVCFSMERWWLIGTSFLIAQAPSIGMAHDALGSVQREKRRGKLPRGGVKVEQRPPPLKKRTKDMVAKATTYQSRHSKVVKNEAMEDRVSWKRGISPTVRSLSILGLLIFIGI
jgi:hypothetical protein